MTNVASAVPTSIRRLDGTDATRLARLVSAYDDLQTVLRCCERLMSVLGEESGNPDDVGIEALWTMALLSYARGFSDDDGPAPLTEADLAAPGEDAEVLRAHRVLLHLRDRYAHASTNPRESYTVGIAQDGSGVPNAIAVTSVRTPLVDRAAVRQAGALAFPLCAVLDERIDPLQQGLLAEVRGMPAAKLGRLPVVQVAAEH
jgi:hypothetical protein